MASRGHRPRHRHPRGARRRDGARARRSGHPEPLRPGGAAARARCATARSSTRRRSPPPSAGSGARRASRVATVIVGVANQRVIVRQAELPAMAEEDLRSALRFQVQELIPIPVDEAILDFQILEQFVGPEQEPMMRILLVAAQRDMVRSLLAAVDGGGPLGLARRRRSRSRSSGRSPAPTSTSARRSRRARRSSASAAASPTWSCTSGACPGSCACSITGGNEITEAIASELHIDPDTAEDLKRRADASSTDELEARAGRIVDRPALPVRRGGAGLDRLLPGPGGRRRHQPRPAHRRREPGTGAGRPVAAGAPRAGRDRPPAARRARRPRRHPRGPADRQRAAPHRAHRARARGAAARRRGAAHVAAPGRGGGRPRAAAAVVRSSAAAVLVLAALLLVVYVGRRSQVADERDKAERAEAGDRRAPPGRGAPVAGDDRRRPAAGAARAWWTSALADDVAWTRLCRRSPRSCPNDVWLTAFTGQKAAAAAPAPGERGHDQRDGPGLRPELGRALVAAGGRPAVAHRPVAPVVDQVGRGRGGDDHVLVDRQPHAAGASRGTTDATGTSGGGS